jgi:hypothetical protein
MSSTKLVEAYLMQGVTMVVTGSEPLAIASGVRGFAAAHSGNPAAFRPVSIISWEAPPPLPIQRHSLLNILIHPTVSQRLTAMCCGKAATLAQRGLASSKTQSAKLRRALTPGGTEARFYFER